MGQKPLQPLYFDNEYRKVNGMRYDNPITSEYKKYANSYEKYPYSPIKNLDDLKHTTFLSIFYREKDLHGRSIENLDRIPVSNTIVLNSKFIKRYKNIINEYVKINEIVGFYKNNGFICPFLRDNKCTGYEDYVLIAIKDNLRFQTINRIISNNPTEEIGEYKIMIPYCDMSNMKTFYKNEKQNIEIVDVKTVMAQPKLKRAIYEYKVYGFEKYGEMKIIIQIGDYIYQKQELTFDPSANEFLFINFTPDGYTKFAVDCEIDVNIDNEIFKPTIEIQRTINVDEQQPSAPKLTELEGH